MIHGAARWRSSISGPPRLDRPIGLIKSKAICRDFLLSMRPLAVLNAIVFGSAIATTFGLGAVLIVFMVLKGRHPELAQELGPLLLNSGRLALLATVSGIALVATLKGLRWRWIAQMAMWFTLAAIVLWYWP